MGPWGHGVSPAEHKAVIPGSFWVFVSHRLLSIYFGKIKGESTTFLRNKKDLVLVAKRRLNTI